MRFTICHHTAVFRVQEAVFPPLIRFRVLLGHRISIRHCRQIQLDMIAINALLIVRSAAVRQISRYMHVQTIKLIYPVIHDLRNFAECIIRYPFFILIDVTSQYHTNRSGYRHFIQVIQTVIVLILPDRAADNALVLLLESGIIMSRILAARQIYLVHCTIGIRHFPYRSTVCCSAGIHTCIRRRNDKFVWTCQISAVQCEVAVLGAVCSHAILCCQIVSAEIFQTELIACGIIHIVDSYPGGQIRQCVFAVCICGIRKGIVGRLPLAAVVVILDCPDDDVFDCRLVLCGICAIILDTVIIAVDPDPSGNVSGRHGYKAGIITGNIFLPENVHAIHSICRAVCIRSCTSKIDVFRQITALRIQVAVYCRIIALLIPGNGIAVGHFACHLQLIIAEIGLAAHIAECVYIVELVLAVCVRRFLPCASGRMIAAVCITVILFQCDLHTRNISFAVILQAVVIRIIPDAAHDLCLFDLLQTAVPVVLVCGIRNVICLSVIGSLVFAIRFRLCICCRDQVLIRCSQINVIALIGICDPESAVTACLCDAISDLAIGILRQRIQFQLITGQITLTADFHKCGNSIKLIVSVAIGFSRYSKCSRYPAFAVPVVLFQRHRQVMHAAFVRCHTAVIIRIVPDASADRCVPECPDAAEVRIPAVTAFCDIVNNNIGTRNCTVSAVIVLVVLRRTSDLFSVIRLCLCCNDQVFLLAHQSECAVIPVQLVVIGEHGNRIAVRQRIQMQLIACQIALAIDFRISGNAFKIIQTVAVGHCGHSRLSLFPGRSIQIILIQCQMEIAAAAFVRIHFAVIVCVIPDLTFHCRGLHGFQSAVIHVVRIFCGNNVILHIAIFPCIVFVESRFTAAICAMHRLLCQQDILARLVEVHGMVWVRILRRCQQVTVDAVSCGIQCPVLGHRVAIRHGIQPQTVACQIHLSANRHKGRLVFKLICTCLGICLNRIFLDKLPASGIVQIILIQIYGLLCWHCRFAGFSQTAVILVEPNCTLNRSGLKCFQTAVVNIDHVCIQYGIVFLVCDSISQIIGIVALCQLCCQEVISIVQCSQIIRFCDPVAVCFRGICCLTISCHRIALRHVRTNAVICQLICAVNYKVGRHLGKLVYAVLVSCDCLICVHLDIPLCSDVIAILFQSDRNAALALFTAVQNAVVIRIFPDLSLYRSSFPLLQSGIQICIISCLYQIVVLLLYSIRGVNVFDIGIANICPVIIGVRFCVVGLRACLCLLCQNQHFVIVFQHGNGQVTCPLAVLCAVISICDIQLAVNLVRLCIIPVLGCRIILRQGFQNNLIACQILYAILFHIGGEIAERVFAVRFCFMCLECCIFRHPFAALVRILLQVYNSRIGLTAVCRLVLILDSVVVGILPDHAADGCGFKCFQTAIVAVIILCFDVIVGVIMISVVHCRIIIENVRFKIGVSVNARLCLRLRLLCGDEIVTVRRRGQIGYRIITAVACSVLSVLRDQVAVHHLSLCIAVLPIAGNGIVFHAVGQRQQLQTIMCQHLFLMDFRICGNIRECVLAVCIGFCSTISACYRNIFAVLQHILFQPDLCIGNSLFVELSRAVRISHGIADTVIVEYLLIFSGCIPAVVLPEITGYFRGLDLCKAAAVFQKALCLAHIIMGILIVDDVAVRI